MKHPDKIVVRVTYTNVYGVIEIIDDDKYDSLDEAFATYIKEIEAHGANKRYRVEVLTIHAVTPDIRDIDV